MEQIGYWKILILMILILGLFVLLMPSPLSEPNFRGAPLIPIITFISAVTLYALVANHRKTLYATVIILFTLFAYTGFWAYSYKMPLSNLIVTLTPIRTGNNPTFQYFGGNQCDITFDLTIRNPTDIDTPPFMIENVHFYINNVKLKLGTYSMWGWHRQGGLREQGIWYYNTHIIIKAHQTLVVSKDMPPFGISIYSNCTKVEEGNFESIWESLIDKNFTLSLSGFFTSRPDFKPGDYSWQSMHVLATTKFTVSRRIIDV